MTKLKKWEIEYDPNLVCSECNKNEFIHYNYTCFHNGEATRDDEFESVNQPGVWCSSCAMEVEMVEPKKYVHLFDANFQVKSCLANDDEIPLEDLCKEIRTRLDELSKMNDKELRSWMNHFATDETS
tara:strand:+ start:202 stop:582 length:381 start_codon:yes stop_codon:yes gene_type:complete